LADDVGLLVIDVTNPEEPGIVGSVNTPGYEALGVAVSGAYAYLANYDAGMQVVRISNAAHPVIVGSVDTPGPTIGPYPDLAVKVTLSGSYAYVANGAAGLAIVPSQCSLPTSVLLSSFQASPQPRAILLEWATSQESAFSGFHVLRSLESEADYRQVSTQLISPPSPYRFLDSEVKPGVTYYYRLEALDRSGSREFFGPVSARLEPNPLRSILGQSFPNPSSKGITIPFTLAKAAEVKVRILDLSGRQVRVVMNATMEEGNRYASWDGLDDRGTPVPAGIYVYQLQTPGFEASRRLVRLQ